MGYAGGTTPNPAYRDIGDHTECFQVDFDPEVISFEDVLQLFWTSHEPMRPAYSRQYASLVLAQDDGQLRLAEASRDGREAALKRPLMTRIAPLERFYLAEAYHQKYRLRNDRLLYAEMWEYYPRDDDLTNSTVAARLNGFADGSARCALVDAEGGEYGLSAYAQEYLRTLCRK